MIDQNEKGPISTIQSIPLYRCILKKSANTLEKLIKFGRGILIAFLKVLVLAIAITTILIAIAIGWTWVSRFVLEILTSLIAALSPIPWECYVAGCCIIAIPLHSTLWCLNKRKTEKEKSDSKTEFNCQED
jgi:hypothetical protein